VAEHNTTSDGASPATSTAILAFTVSQLQLDKRRVSRRLLLSFLASAVVAGVLAEVARLLCG
jgi:hypothetical protein